MFYNIELKPRAVRDLEKLSRQDQERIRDRINDLKDNLKGDVKKLVSFQPPYRLRVGRYRALFEIVGNQVIIYRIKIRGKAYD